MSEFKEIKLSELFVSSTNPRSEFEENSLNELAQSFKEHGVLQPIIVREQSDRHDKYEVVCGERRFRAAKIAKLKTIPASVRELSDDEVFEIQIVENLERKDVHPLDEAVAFKKMLESGKYTMEDIAAKVAKTTAFVAQRLKLNDLIPELKEDFKSGKFGIGHAILLARVDEDQQKEIFEEYEGGEYPTISELKYDLVDLKLDEAKFDIEDQTLVPEAGACSACPKSSFGNAVLFPDYEEKICFDRKCFNHKEEVFESKYLQRIIDENPGMPIVKGWNDLDEHIKKVIEDNGKSVLNGQDYNNKIGGIKAFHVGFWDFRGIEIREKAMDKVSDSPELSLQLEISNLKSKASRDLELDREKIMKRIREEIIKNPDKNLITDTPLLLDETPAFLVALYEQGRWEFRSWMQKRFGVDRLYSDGGEQFIKFKNIPAVVNDEMEIYRAFTVLNLQSDYSLDFENNSKTKALYEYVKVSYEKEIELYTLEQNDVAAKRIAKSDARIADLEAKLKDAEENLEEETILQKCRVCGCTEDDCSQCIEKTGQPCYWIEDDLCSACVETPANSKKKK